MKFNFHYLEAAQATNQNVSNLLKKIAYTDTCWLWTAKSKAKFGYGLVRAGQKMWYAHRLIWTLTYGVIPDGMCVLHICDIPGCVRPDHLRLGTTNDNVQDRVVKGRSASGSANGMNSKPEARPCGDRNGSRSKPESRPKGEAHSISIRQGLAKSVKIRDPSTYARGERHSSKTKPDSVPKGERNGHSILTETQVLEIRSKAAAGISIPDIAKDYPVKPCAIWRIVSKKSWKHL